MKIEIRSAAVAACVLLAAGAALAQQPARISAPRPLTPRITILTAAAGDIDLEPLRKAISAHLSPYAVTVEIVDAVPMSADEAPTPLDLARRTLVARDAIAVVWVDAQRSAFTSFVADAETGGWTLERSFPEDPGAWIASCDGLASLLHAALLPSLRVEPAAATPPRPTDAAAGHGGRGAAAQASLEKSVRPARPKPTGALGLLVNLGYGPVILNPAGDVQHGARAALGVSFARGFELVVGLDLLFPFEVGSDAPGTGIRLVRWPFRVAMGWAYSFNKVHVGARVGFVLDTASIRGLDGDAAAIDAQEAERVNPGLMTSIRLRVDLIQEFSFFMDVTADWYYRAYTYKWAGERVLEYGAIQTGLIAGVSVQFDVI